MHSGSHFLTDQGNDFVFQMSKIRYATIREIVRQFARPTIFTVILPTLCPKLYFKSILSLTIPVHI